MKFSLLQILVACLAALLALPLAAEEEEKKKKKRKERQEPVAQAQAVVQGALPSEITSLFPIGREFKGVALPSYEDERLKSVMNADSIVRIDEQYLDLENLIITIYNAADEPETTIQMDEALYDLVIGELTSKTPARIEQPRFTMTGEKMVFDTRSQVSRLVGNVRVIVPDAGDLAPDFGFPVPGGR